MIAITPEDGDRLRREAMFDLTALDDVLKYIEAGDLEAARETRQRCDVAFCVLEDVGLDPRPAAGVLSLPREQLTGFLHRHREDIVAGLPHLVKTSKAPDEDLAVPPGVDVDEERAAEVRNSVREEYAEDVDYDLGVLFTCNQLLLRLREQLVLAKVAG